MVRFGAQGLDKHDAENIARDVETYVLKLLFAREPSRQAEFLEVAFNQVVHRQTLKEIEKHQNSLWGDRGEFVFPEPYRDDDLQESAEPLELVPANGRRPEEIICQPLIIGRYPRNNIRSKQECTP